METNGNDGYARPFTLEELEGGQQEIVDRDRDRLAAVQARIPEPQNHGYALALSHVATLEFGSRVFRVPPVPYPAGVRLQFVQKRLRKISKEDEADPETARDLLAVCEEAVAVFYSLIEPVSLWDRLVWRWRSNPFLQCTEAEIGQLLGFFSACRTRSRVRLQNQPLSAIPPFQISRRSAPWSLAGVRRGSARTDTR